MVEKIIEDCLSYSSYFAIYIPYQNVYALQILHTASPVGQNEQEMGTHMYTNVVSPCMSEFVNIEVKLTPAPGHTHTS